MSSATIQWRRLGAPCPHDVNPDPKKRSRCGQSLAIETMISVPVGPKNGPQGVYECPAGHRGWIWFDDCEFTEETTC